MVAYNFHKRFVEPIESGAKRQTIRKRGRRRHANQGDNLQLYFAQRTQYCRKILDAVCSSVHRIDVHLDDDCFTSIEVDGVEVHHSKWNQFARADGFENIEDWHKYWIKCRGTEPMIDGVLVKW